MARRYRFVDPGVDLPRVLVDSFVLSGVTGEMLFGQTPNTTLEMEQLEGERSPPHPHPHPHKTTARVLRSGPPWFHVFFVAFALFAFSLSRREAEFGSAGVGGLLGGNTESDGDGLRVVAGQPVADGLEEVEHLGRAGGDGLVFERTLATGGDLCK